MDKLSHPLFYETKLLYYVINYIWFDYCLLVNEARLVQKYEM